MRAVCRFNGRSEQYNIYRVNWLMLMLSRWPTPRHDLQEEIDRRKKRAERFGMPVPVLKEEVGAGRGAPAGRRALAGRGADPLVLGGCWAEGGTTGAGRVLFSCVATRRRAGGRLLVLHQRQEPACMPFLRQPLPPLVPPTVPSCCFDLY